MKYCIKSHVLGIVLLENVMCGLKIVVGNRAEITRLNISSRFSEGFGIDSIEPFRSNKRKCGNPG